MIANPSESDYPSGIYTQITIHARLVSKDTWEIRCPEWKCVLHNRNLTNGVALLVAEIESHNEEEKTGEPGWFSKDFDFNKWAEKNGMTRLRAEQWPKAPRRTFGLLSNG